VSNKGLETKVFQTKGSGPKTRKPFSQGISKANQKFYCFNNSLTKLKENPPLSKNKNRSPILIKI